MILSALFQLTKSTRWMGVLLQQYLALQSCYRVLFILEVNHLNSQHIIHDFYKINNTVVLFQTFKLSAT